MVLWENRQHLKKTTTGTIYGGVDRVKGNTKWPTELATDLPEVWGDKRRKQLLKTNGRPWRGCLSHGLEVKKPWGWEWTNIPPWSLPLRESFPGGSHWADTTGGRSPGRGQSPWDGEKGEGTWRGKWWLIIMAGLKQAIITQPGAILCSSLVSSARISMEKWKKHGPGNQRPGIWRDPVNYLLYNLKKVISQ